MNIFLLIVEKKIIDISASTYQYELYIYDTGVFLAVCICTDMTNYATIEYNYNQ